VNNASRLREDSLISKSVVVIYSRPGCHLCDEAKLAMSAADCAEWYTLEEINIETDPALLHLYRYDIPVITIDGVEAFRHTVSGDEFKAKIVNRKP
jgi:glutaredoxin